MLQKSFDSRIEEKWQKYWLENNTYAFQPSSDKPLYSLDTPPPFTSGELHMGHVLSYAYFDFVARYKRMNGFNVFYPQGWDTQGFPTETRVEKKYGRLPPQEFRKRCVEWTEEMVAKMRDSMVRMGYSPDWNYQYRTMDPEYHRKVQLSLLQMHGKKMVYRAKHPVYWCTRCRSALAKTDTEDVERGTLLNYFIFTGPKGEPLEIATTRPELMPACVAVMFHPEDGRYRHLAGKTVATALGKKVPAIADKDVLKDFGTGLLMVCTFGDKMDVIWAYRHKLPAIDTISPTGKMQNTGLVDNMTVEDAKKAIIEMLREKGKLVKQEQLQQTVKLHDRCKHPVEFLPSYQWFADITKHRDAIKKLAEKIEWIPSFGIHYLYGWADSVEWDWVISRQRVFGTPLPFYYCEKCGETRACDEDELPFSPERAREHRCPRCGEKMRAETSTCDVWVDSSITPLVIADWPEIKNPGLYPSSLRPQGVEIVRTWAFYTIYRSGLALTGKPPWKTILLNGNVLAPDGRKMSKSLGNVVQPTELLKDYQTDALRQWAAMSGAMAKDRPFSFEDIKFAKTFLNKWWNGARFIETALAGYSGGKKPHLKRVDRWMLEQLNKSIEQATEFMEKYEFHAAIKLLQNFFWHDVCDDYLEYVKYRIYGEDAEGRKAAQYVLHTILYDFIKLMAPFTPHISEELYAEMFGGKEGKSVHLASWPKVGERFPGENIEVEELRALVSTVRQHKASGKLSQAAWLSRVKVSLPRPLHHELQEELKNIARIKELELKEGEFGMDFSEAKPEETANTKPES
ncbi:MAG: valine--tRNA ligase [Candidatus Micrarchaeota archaeon]